MKTRRMMAVKPHKYGTRHLTAGEEYDVPVRYAVALLASRKARYAAPRPPGEPLSAPVQDMLPPEPAASGNEIDGLRLQATQLGINVDGRWGVVRLQHEIAKAHG